MARKAISRLPATPRLIREIKPKRQLPRKSSTQEIAEGDDDWWSQSAHGGIETSSLAAAPLATSGVGARSRFNREETYENSNQDEPKSHNKGLKHSLRERWARFKRTPLRKKMRQFFWSVVFFHSVKIIYTADLENQNWQMQLPLEHDNYYPANAKPMSKSMFTEEDRGQTSLFSRLSSEANDNSHKSGRNPDLKSISSYFFGSSSGNAGQGDSMYSSSNNQNNNIMSNSFNMKTNSNSPLQQRLSFGSLGDPFGNLLSQPKSFSATGRSDSTKPDALANLYADAQSLQRLHTGNSLDASGSGKSAITDSFVKTESVGSLGRVDLDGSGVFPKSQGYSSPQIKSFGAALDRIGSNGDGRDSSTQSKSFGAASSLRSLGLDPLTISDSSSESQLLSVLTVKSAQAIGARGSLVSSSEAILPNSFPNDTESASSGIFNYGLSPIKHSLETRSFTSALPIGERINRETLKLDSRLEVAGRNKYNNAELDGAETGHSNKKQQSAADLNCELHGGPHPNAYSELIYWRDVPSDASFTSQYYSPQSQEQSRGESNTFWKTKYLTFEMDSSGWNNMRLGFENVVLMAHAMGRTLVMPPKRQLAHGLRDEKGKKVVSFSDFYDISAIDAEQSGLNIITMEQFLEREAMNGNLKGQYPPDNNRVKWDNQHLQPLWAYISNVTEVFDWHPNECILVILGHGSDEQNLLIMMDDILNGKDGRPFPHPSEYQGKPTRVDAPTVERLREVLAGRKKMCIYNKHIHSAHDVVHFRADETDGTRLITQFYAFLWFEDWKQDLWAKRFVRDHLRYRDEIMCLAARIVTAIRAHARERDPSNANGHYDAIHVRRTDFSSQFPDTALSASEILSQIQQNVDSGSTLFIATDEHNRTFFRDIEAVYDVKYLGDFSSEISSINPNFFGLVEQIVASRSRVFIGTYYSSFSAYIVRLRGYYSVKEHRDGYKSGGLRDTYYLPAKYKNVMRMYHSVYPPFYAQDFPCAWRDIDNVE